MGMMRSDASAHRVSCSANRMSIFSHSASLDCMVFVIFLDGGVRVNGCGVARCWTTLGKLCVTLNEFAVVAFRYSRCVCEQRTTISC